MENLKSRCWQTWYLVTGCLLGPRQLSLMWQRGAGVLSGIPFIRILILFMMAPPLQLSPLWKTHLPILSLWRLAFQPLNWRGSWHSGHSSNWISFVLLHKNLQFKHCLCILLYRSEISLRVLSKLIPVIFRFQFLAGQKPSGLLLALLGLLSSWRTSFLSGGPHYLLDFLLCHPRRKILLLKVHVMDSGPRDRSLS